jgi:DNA-binding beta-propeller fold protein YncE
MAAQPVSTDSSTARMLRVVNDDDTITTCALGANGVLTGCNRTTANNLNSVYAMAYSAQARTVYFLQDGDTASPLASCRIDAAGNPSNCIAQNGGGTIVAPEAMTLNSSGSVAYVVNGSGTISVCSVGSDGMLACDASDGGGLFNDTVALRLHSTASGNYAYLINGGTNETITVCSVAADGKLGNCSVQNGSNTFSDAKSIAFNPNGHYAYVSNSGNGTISICAVGTDGSLTSCAIVNARSRFAGIQRTVLDTAGNNAYIVDAAASSISQCSIVNEGAAFGTCTPFHIKGFKVTWWMSLVNNGTSEFSYILSSENSSIFSCQLTVDGGFSGCIRNQ